MAANDPQDATATGDSSPPLGMLARTMLDYWRAMPRPVAGGLPLRADIDIIGAVPQIAACVFLIEVEGLDRFRFRLLGSGLTERSGRNITGELIDETTYGEHVDEALRPLNRVLRTAKPCRVYGRPRSVRNNFGICELIETPLASRPGGPVEWILGTMEFFREPPNAPHGGYAPIPNASIEFVILETLD